MCSCIPDKYPVNIILGQCAKGLPFPIPQADHRMEFRIPGSNGKHAKPLMHYVRTHFFFAALAGIRRHSTLRNKLEELGSHE